MKCLQVPIYLKVFAFKIAPPSERRKKNPNKHGTRTTHFTNDLMAKFPGSQEFFFH